MKSLIQLSILFLFFSTACKKDNKSDCFKGTGEIITETREISGFDSIYVQNNINVVITIDTIWEIKVEAGENMLPKIITKVDNGKLSLSNINQCNFVRSFKNSIIVFIKLPSIKGIETDGDGYIKSTNIIKVDKLDIKTNNTGDLDLLLNAGNVSTYIHGSSDVILTGTTAFHNVSIRGTGFAKCSELVTQETMLYSNTTGNAYVNVIKDLNATIAGSGNVYYSGNPKEIKSKIIGSGQLLAY